MKGLCGLYDQNMVNDFTTERGPEAHAADFADQFLSKGVCDSQFLTLPESPCSADLQVNLRLCNTFLC